jgi:hypothetical protein
VRGVSPCLLRSATPSLTSPASLGPPPPPTWAPRAAVTARRSLPKRHPWLSAELAGSLLPPSPASSSSPPTRGARRARSLPLRSGRAGGFGLRGDDGGGGASEREGRAQVPVSHRYLGCERRRASGAEPEPEPSARAREPETQRARPAPGDRPRRAPIAPRQAGSPRSPRPLPTPAHGARSPPACPEAARGSPGDVTAAPRSP